jgi:hypothetical protein
MSEPEGFLSRWRRLKREAGETREGAPARDPQLDANADTAPPDAPSDADVPVSSTLDAPTVDLSVLPPIDSITATTDIRAFLAPGVPADLTRAALRRAWVVDPRIRDFVGIAENQWDFTAADSIPGFGPLGPLDDVRRLVGRVFGETDDEPRARAVAADEEGSTDLAKPVDSEAPDQVAGSPTGDQSEVPRVADADGAASSGSRSPVDVRGGKTISAPHDDEVAEPAARAVGGRAHGGALPK